MSTDTPTVQRLTRAEYAAVMAAAGQHDAYLQPGYVEATAVIEQGEPYYLYLPAPGHAESTGRAEPGASGVVCVLLVRELPPELQPVDGPTLFDAITPYGYGGPVGLGTAPPLAAFRQLFAPWCREHGIVTAFFRFHPLLDNASAAPAGTEVVPLVGTVAWQLTADRDLEAGMNQRHRRLVRKARREGVEIEVTRGAGRLADFQDLYNTTMQRQHADEFYFFPNKYWHTLANAFGDDLVFVTALSNGNPIASLLCLAGGPFLHYHLGATADVARSNGASNLCFLTAAQWGQAAGSMTHLHLGGGVGGKLDELYEFKLRFDPDNGAVAAAIGKLVCDPERYRALTGSAATEGFFPAWRRPDSAETPAGAEQLANDSR